MLPTLFACLALVAAAPGPKDPPKKDPAIVGEWVLDTIQVGGAVAPREKSVLSVTFAADGKATAKENGQVTKEEHEYRIDLKKNPAEIDITPLVQGREDVVTGIFKIEGDTMTLCFSMGGKRPAAFASPAGEQTMLMTLKRVKKE